MRMDDLFDPDNPGLHLSAIERRRLKRERRKEKYRKFAEWQEDSRDARERIKVGAALYYEALAAMDAIKDAKTD